MANECFRWCHIRYLNAKDNNPQKIEISDKLMVDQLNYDGFEFPVSVKDYAKIEAQNRININVFGYENKKLYPIYVSKQNEDMLNLLLITEDEKTNHVLIKDFNRWLFNKTKHEHRSIFACTACNGLAVRMY